MSETPKQCTNFDNEKLEEEPAAPPPPPPKVMNLILFFVFVFRRDCETSSTQIQVGTVVSNELLL